MTAAPCDTLGADLNAATCKHGMCFVFGAGKRFAIRTFVRLMHTLGADVTAAMSSSNYGWTLMHEASARDDVEMVRLLHGFGADVNAATTDGSTPFHVATSKGNVQTLRLLHELGASIVAG